MKIETLVAWVYQCENVNIKSNITSPNGYDWSIESWKLFSEPNRNLQNATSYFIQANINHVYIIVSFNEECTETCYPQKFLKFVYFFFSYWWLCSN